MNSGGRGERFWWRRMGSEKPCQERLPILRGEGDKSPKLPAGGPAVCKGRWGALQPRGNPSLGGSSPHRARGPSRTQPLGNLTVSLAVGRALRGLGWDDSHPEPRPAPTILHLNNDTNYGNLSQTLKYMKISVSFLPQPQVTSAANRGHRNRPWSRSRMLRGEGSACVGPRP